MMKTVLNITAVLSLVGIFILGYIYIEKRYALDEELKATQKQLERYALDEELKATQKQLDIKINSDYLKEIRVRIWTLEERIDKNPDDITAKEELRKLKEEKEEVKEKLRALIE